MLAALKEEFSTIAFITADVTDDVGEDLAMQFELRILPTIIIFDKDDDIVEFWEGPQSEETLRNVLQDLIEMEQEKPNGTAS